MSKPLDAAGYDTDKSRLFLRNYQAYFSQFNGAHVNVLEIRHFPRRIAPPVARLLYCG